MTDTTALIAEAQARAEKAEAERDALAEVIRTALTVIPTQKHPHEDDSRQRLVNLTAGLLRSPDIEHLLDPSPLTKAEITRSHELAKPGGPLSMSMLVSRDRMREQIASDPDLPAEAGAEPWDPAHSPGHTDLMISPEAIAHLPEELLAATAARAREASAEVKEMARVDPASMHRPVGPVSAPPDRESGVRYTIDSDDPDCPITHMIKDGGDGLAGTWSEAKARRIVAALSQVERLREALERIRDRVRADIPVARERVRSENPTATGRIRTQRKRLFLGEDVLEICESVLALSETEKGDG